MFPKQWSHLHFAHLQIDGDRVIFLCLLNCFEKSEVLPSNLLTNAETDAREGKQTGTGNGKRSDSRENELRNVQEEEEKDRQARRLVSEIG